MPKIKQSAILERNGNIATEPAPANHGKIARKHQAKGKHGFITDDGDFVDRQEGKKIAKQAKQAKVRGRRGLHSRDVY